MAKKSKIVKNLKKIQTVNKYREKRKQYKDILSDPDKSFDEKMEKLNQKINLYILCSKCATNII